jgi:hypothetical protein
MPASTVTEYLAALPADRRDALTEVRLLRVGAEAILKGAKQRNADEVSASFV